MVLRDGEADVEDDIMVEDEANYSQDEPEGEDLNDNFEGYVKLALLRILGNRDFTY